MSDVAVKERPILMSAPMVRACLREVDPKEQTRRVIKPQPGPDAADAGVIGSDDPKSNGLWLWLTAGGIDASMADGSAFRCPYGVPGDRLWVREAWKPHSLYAGMKPRDMPQQKVFCRADETYAPSNTPWVPGIHMPRWASRLTLEITDVRVERLQDISEADALAEGIDRIRYPEVGEWGWPQRKYRELWEFINGPGSWAANPWVWAISFRRIP